MSFRPDYTNEMDELVERLADEPDGTVRFRTWDGKEDVMSPEAFASEFVFIGKDTETDCEHGIPDDKTCPICD